MSTFEFHEFIGMVGVGLILLCYFLIQTGKMSAENLSYSIINMAGALLILFSLYFEFNFASVLIESFWVLISLIGIFRFLSKKNRLFSAIRKIIRLQYRFSRMRCYIYGDRTWTR